MKFVLLVIMVFLTGCMTTPAPKSVATDVSTNTIRTGKFPLLSGPPNPGIFIDEDGNISRSEAEKYYTALEDYHVYLTSYLTYLDVKYKMGKGKRFTFTCTAMTRPSKISLPPLPVIRDIPDNDVPDELLNHIGLLRTAIIEFNTEVERINNEIDKHC